MIRKKQVFVDVREVGPMSQAQARYVPESNTIQSHLHLFYHTKFSNQLHCYLFAGPSAFISRSWRPLQIEATPWDTKVPTPECPASMARSDSSGTSRGSTSTSRVWSRQRLSETIRSYSKSSLRSPPARKRFSMLRIASARASLSILSSSGPRVCTSTSGSWSLRESSVKTKRLPGKYSAWNQI